MEVAPRFVAYYRVSTSAQGASGLGIEAQKAAVQHFVRSRGGIVEGEFVEIESGTLRIRPQLKRALENCERTRATLVIARLDRLARNLFVIASLMESRVEFVAADMPSATKLTIQLIAAMAEHERDQISKNTRLALKAAKARGTVLGNPKLSEARPLATAALKKSADAFAERIAGHVSRRQYVSLSLSEIARRLNADGVQTQRGKRWTPTGVRNVMVRTKLLKDPE